MQSIIPTPEALHRLARRLDLIGIYLKMFGRDTIDFVEPQGEALQFTHVQGHAGHTTPTKSESEKRDTNQEMIDVVLESDDEFASQLEC